MYLCFSKPALLEGLEGDQYIWSVCMYCMYIYFSKPALLEGLEVDQYMWSVLQNPACIDAEEVQVDQHANMKPLHIKVETLEFILPSLLGERSLHFGI